MTVSETDTALLSVEGLSKSFSGTKVLEACDLAVEPGEIVSLLGPSGCGKTTLLRLIAGLERADGGVIRLKGEVVEGNGTWVGPENRQVGMVFQDWALFPHLTVSDNVGYGLPRRRRDTEVPEVLHRVNLPGVQDRMPETLSGGQQQRAALARALAPQPAVLLLDEPFSNLDASLRREVRTEVRHLLQAGGMTAVFVTHDREEALALGDRVAVMSEGQIVQIGVPGEIYQRPRTPWVAGFVGAVTMYPATAEGTVAETDFGSVPLQSSHRGPVQVAIRPESVDLRIDDPEAASHVVEHYEYRGPSTLVTVTGPCGVHLQARVSGTPSLDLGDRVQPVYTHPPATAWPTQ